MKLGIRKRIGLLLILITLLALGIFTFLRYSKTPNNVVIDPESRQKILVNELIILASDKEKVSKIVKEFNGETTISVTETGTYQVKFPVNNLAELNIIMGKIINSGIKVQHVLVLEPPKPGGPQ